jgi:hypothetical protein
MTAAETVPPAARPVLDVRRIYLEPAAEVHPRGREILARFPDAERVPVRSHWQIPELHGNAELADDWNRVKRTTLVLGARKSMDSRPNGRSAEFVGPGASNGCAMACAYCYVARRKGFANPITVFVNNDKILAFLARHAAKQGSKLDPNQVDHRYWVYDVGENGDCSVDALISDNVRDTVAFFRDEVPNAKASFATKFDPTPGDAGRDAPSPGRLAAAVVVVPFVGVQLGRAPTRAPGALPDRQHRVEQRFEEAAVVDVGRAEQERERDAVRVDQDVPLGAGLAAVGRVRPDVLAPFFAGKEALSSEQRPKSVAFARPSRSSSARWSRSKTPAVCQSRSLRQ